MAGKLNKFKCVTACFYDDRLWTPRDKKLLYSTEKEIPHFKNLSLLDKDEKVVSEGEDKLAQIKSVLMGMDIKDDEQWTKDGLPQVRFVEKSAGFDTNRGEITRAFSGFTRDSEITPLSGQQPDFLT